MGFKGDLSRVNLDLREVVILNFKRVGSYSINISFGVVVFKFKATDFMATGDMQEILILFQFTSSTLNKHVQI